MTLRKPITTFGGLLWWTTVAGRTNKYLVMQKHHLGPPLWPYRYRILLRASRMEVANANDRNEIELDWELLEEQGVQMDQSIDFGEVLRRLLERL